MLRFTSTLLLLFVTLAPHALAADYPRWGQGWTRNMAIEGQKNLPVTFKPAKKDYATGKKTLPPQSGVKWMATIGNVTCTSAIVAEGKVLIGTNNGSPRDPKITDDCGILACFDEKTGKFLWQLAVPKFLEIRWADWYHMGICSTPTIEDGKAYLVTNRSDVICLDINGTADGKAKILWKYSLYKELGVQPHDASVSSVILDGDLLYIGSGNAVVYNHRGVAAPEAPSFVVLNKKTGKLVAKDNFKIGDTITHGQWSSPTMGMVDGKKRIFYGSANGAVYAVDALTKVTDKPQLLDADWMVHGHPAAQTGPVPPPVHQTGSPCYIVTANPVFYDGDLFVHYTQEPFHRMKKGYLARLDPRGYGDKTRSAFKWKYEAIGSSVSTPAITKDGLIFVTNFAGDLHCIDAKTAECYWTHKLNVRELWGSPLVADGKVYIGTDRHYLYVFEAKKKKKLLTELRVGEFKTSLSAANGVLYVPAGGTLYAVGK